MLHGEPVLVMPLGYKVGHDVRMNVYYVLKRATLGRGHAEPGWDYVKDPLSPGSLCYETEDEAEHACIWEAFHDGICNVNGFPRCPQCGCFHGPMLGDKPRSLSDILHHDHTGRYP